MTARNRPRRTLCHLSDIADPGSKGFVLEDRPSPLEIFVVRRGDQVYGYLNSCPHTGGPLDWMPDQFLSIDRNEIQCASHDARFRIEDGACLAGPCGGRSLTPIPVRVEAGEVVVDEPDEDGNW